jgi:hypothetical protein
VLFSWAPDGGLPHSGQGVTRDINTSGVYVFAKIAPQVGSRVQVDVLLPNFTDGSSGMHLYGEGAVLRVERFDGNGNGARGTGFAAAVQFFPEASDAVLSHLKRSVLVE